MDEKHIQNAIKVLKQGGIVIYPTDTAFGIGCRIDIQESVDKLFAIRKRPRSKATPVLVSSKAMALAYLDHPKDIVRRLMKTYWPGALTIVAECNIDRVYSPIRGNGNTVGLRMPDHETAIRLIEAVGVPILGPSANFHGEKTPFRYEDLDPELMKLVDCIVPGVCTVGMASTVVDCSVTPCRILRQGAVSL